MGLTSALVPAPSFSRGIFHTMIRGNLPQRRAEDLAWHANLYTTESE
jgi:hypothetical protein